MVVVVLLALPSVILVAYRGRAEVAALLLHPASRKGLLQELLPHVVDVGADEAVDGELEDALPVDRHVICRVPVRRHLRRQVRGSL